MFSILFYCRHQNDEVYENENEKYYIDLYLEKLLSKTITKSYEFEIHSVLLHSISFQSFCINIEKSLRFINNVTTNYKTENS